ncbi:MAG: type III secretion system export apparatus subunit SctR [Parachlamydiaceae bacterium]|nr:type III secretion system export apparatus subunit SctR [Parachlamydiaceae bacterium]
MAYVSRIFTLKFFICLLVAAGVFWISPEKLFSQPTGRSTTSLVPETKSAVDENEKTPGQRALEGDYGTFKRPSLITQAILLTIFSLLPFIIMILSPFMKIVIVLSLLRSALGVQQSPPNQILNGVAFMLSIFIVYPTGLKMYDAAYSTINEMRAPESFVSADASTYIIQVTTAAREPGREFLKKNSSAKHQALFYRMAYRMLPEEHRAELQPSDFMVLVPSFITSQLKDAFEIGVLIYIPFFVIDLVTSNILLAMGMMMLSPVTISMPLKLFLLVMLDGWTLLIEGLVNTFH